MYNKKGVRRVPAAVAARSHLSLTLQKLRAYGSAWSSFLVFCVATTCRDDVAGRLRLAVAHHASATPRSPSPSQTRCSVREGKVEGGRPLHGQRRAHHLPGMLHTVHPPSSIRTNSLRSSRRPLASGCPFRRHCLGWPPSEQRGSSPHGEAEQLQRARIAREAVWWPCWCCTLRAFLITILTWQFPSRNVLRQEASPSRISHRRSSPIDCICISSLLFVDGLLVLGSPSR